MPGTVEPMALVDPALPLIARFLDHPDRCGIVTDFDGTLAPIVDDPEDSRPLPGAVELLHRLADRFAMVAVVSGRPAGFLVDQLRVGAASKLHMSGLYGLETATGASPAAEPWRAVVAQIAAVAEATAPHGLLVERKGLSVTLHYRNAPEHEAWARRFADHHAQSSGLLVHAARMSEELRPPLDIDKGSVVAGLVAGLDAACFIGDDVGDLPAFAALDETASALPSFQALKVAVSSTEMPPALLASADLVVDGPEGALNFLRRLLAPVKR